MVRVLLLGGHGKVALHMTKLLAAQNHSVTSIIRNPDHVKEIQELAPPNSPSLVNPVVASLEESDENSAKEMMNGMDWVVWSAGAGGKGGPERTKAVDEVAAKRFISAALDAPSVKKFLMVSASCARKTPASYWNDEDVALFHRIWDMIPVYCETKMNADAFLFEESRKTQKKEWEDIHLRPGHLLDEPGTGKVDLGRTRATGAVSRQDVALAAVELLKRDGSGGLWLDLLGGEEDVEAAVDRVIKNKVTAKE